ncbi:sigma-54-dependent transcriptional regulator [Anaeromicrobium sediminis]|uniref:Stage 0 sporulation protein A homolog n=1 Tax=Anaeromicrobium sediminis TaxID=1478221 RepID=A0A267MMJ3_9FIRM|nr:sigma-54 dependent transcriptional regulator [Anaeromicrobium sediminis]PAB60095.1 hypothetical protein CCE28_06900 [Anaeromicrobium sediminis]
MKRRILIVEDEMNLKQNLSFIFEKEGFEVTSASDGSVAKELITSNIYEIILCDIRLPNVNGLELIRLKKEIDYDGKFIIMTAYGTIESAVEAIKLGAEEYITKPFVNDDIIRIVNRLLHIQRLENENEKFKTKIKKRYELKKNIIGSSCAMQEVFNKVNKVSKVHTSVLITGENGTGKELIARAIHSYSDRASEPFLPVNCAAIPENLFESEFFGHEKGAFTGATEEKKGMFQIADGGTIFLDEISEIPLHMQVKLLRVLQENVVRRVGGSNLYPFSTRIISSSNRNLEQMVEDGLFRQDLYYRIKIVEIKLPPLRKRQNDILLLIDHFIEKYAKLFKRNINTITEEAIEFLRSYSWPGNVRELEHVVQSAIVLADDETLRINDFINMFNETKSKIKIAIPDDTFDLKNVLSQVKMQAEKEMIERALTKANGNRTKAAQILGISHRNILYKLQEYNIVCKEDDL